MQAASARDSSDPRLKSYLALHTLSQLRGAFVQLAHGRTCRLPCCRPGAVSVRIAARRQPEPASRLRSEVSPQPVSMLPLNEQFIGTTHMYGTAGASLHCRLTAPQHAKNPSAQQSTVPVPYRYRKCSRSRLWIEYKSRHAAPCTTARCASVRPARVPSADQDHAKGTQRMTGLGGPPCRI